VAGYPKWLCKLSTRTGNAILQSPIPLAAPPPRSWADVTAWAQTRTLIGPLNRYGAVQTVVIAQAALDGIESANHVYDALGYGPGTGYNRQNQRDAALKLISTLDAMGNAVDGGALPPPAPATRRPAGPTAASRASVPDILAGSDWPETKAVRSAVVQLMEEYPEKTGTGENPWAEIAVGTAMVGVSTVAIVTTAGVGLTAVIPAVIATVKRAEAVQADPPSPGSAARPASSVAVVDPLEEAIPFALVALALAIGI